MVTLQLDDLIADMKTKFPDLFRTPLVASIDRSLQDRNLWLYNTFSTTPKSLQDFSIYLSGVGRDIVIPDGNGMTRPALFNIWEGKFEAGYATPPVDMSAFDAAAHPIRLHFISPPYIHAFDQEKLVNPGKYDQAYWRKIAATGLVLDLFPFQGVMEVADFQDMPHTGNWMYLSKQYGVVPEAARRTA